MSLNSDQTPNSKSQISSRTARLADDLSKCPLWIQQAVDVWLHLYEQGLFFGADDSHIKMVLDSLVDKYRPPKSQAGTSNDMPAVPAMTPSEQQASLELENDRIRVAFAIVGQLVASGLMPINLNQAGWHTDFESAIWTVVQGIDQNGL